MGTRNLTMVINKAGETKVAQYGQWDGYPEGQGKTILNFLRECNIDEFDKKLNKIQWFTDKEIDQLNRQENPLKAHPWLSRDLGGQILEAIYYGQYTQENVWGNNKTTKCHIDRLVDSSSFAGDGLFCEWAYVVDLSKNTFEVYEGYGKELLTENDRFYSLSKEGQEYQLPQAHRQTRDY